jgi:hypothetical protein
MQLGLTKQHKNKTCVSWFYISVPLKEDIKVIMIVILGSGIAAGVDKLTPHRRHTLIADVCLRFVYIFGPQTYKMSKGIQTVNYVFISCATASKNKTSLAFILTSYLKPVKAGP